MLTITIQVNAPSGQAIGIKEDIATYLEKFGDAKVVSVVEKLPEQLRIDRPPQRGAGPAERTRQAVYATGNRWAIENFEATFTLAFRDSIEEPEAPPLMAELESNIRTNRKE